MLSTPKGGKMKEMDIAEDYKVNLKVLLAKAQTHAENCEKELSSLKTAIRNLNEILTNKVITI